ncbi:MAG: polyprenyl synthetase family protein [Clostridia bacterium]|nr:polyprenyl synthetase family protein [Clostridia bacterium]
MTFDKKYAEYLSYFNESFDSYLNSLSTVPNNLLDAIKYSANAGGKRIRPVLLFLANDTLGGKKEEVLPFAIAIECIHTYSLIHDDLPAIDNDDFRRGQLSNHKKFGEAMAILAGDSLLNLAYETVLNLPTFSTKHAKSLKLLAEYAGVGGMIKGQILDLFGGEDLNNIDGISQILLNKTAKL